MPVYRPIKSAEQLPQERIEHDTFDAKGEYHQAEEHEIAKDLAAFANHMGGYNPSRRS